MYLIRRGSIWYVCWKWNGVEHRWAAFPSKGISQAWGAKLQRVLDARQSGEPIKGELRQLIVQLSRKQSAELLKLGVLDAQDFASPTLDAMIVLYQKHLESLNRGPVYLRHQIQRVRNCMAGIRAAKIEDLKETETVSYLRELRGDLSAATVNHYLTALKAFVAWAVRRQLAESNPLIHVRRLNVAVEGVTRNRRALNDREIAALLRTTKKTDLGRYWLYRIALETGLRRGEIRGLKIGNVDLKAGWVHVPAAYSRKAGRLRSVPLSNRTAKDLRVYWRGRKGDSVAFYVPGRTSEWLELDLKAAGINPHTHRQVVDFHSLRHSYATRAGKETATFADLMELLGHQTPAMTARYAHAESSRLKAVAERLAQ